MLAALYYGIFVLVELAAFSLLVRHRKVRYSPPPSMQGNQFQLRRAVRARKHVLEAAPAFALVIALLEYQGFPVYGIHAVALAFFAGQGMYLYSVLQLEHYINGKLSTKPIWRIRGELWSKNVLIAAVIALILQSLANIFSA